MTTPARARARINVAASIPETGASKVTSNVIAIWDEDASLSDVEASIKEAARKAVVRARVVHSPPPVHQLVITFPES